MITTIAIFFWKSFLQLKLSYVFAVVFGQCYVILWPALTWRGQEWTQHVQGQLLHTCIMKAAGSHHVMELLSVNI